MKSLFRAIRYSSVGIFLAGIFTTIVGCSNEDQLRALILFLLLLLTGGGGMMEEEAPPAVTFSGAELTNFSGSDHSNSSFCTGFGGLASGRVITPVFQNLDERFVAAAPMSSGGGPGSYTVLSGNDELHITTTDVCNTNEFNIVFQDRSNTNNTDFSAFSTIKIRVTTLTGGPVTGCRIRIENQTGNLGAKVDFDLVQGINVVSIAGGTNMNVMDQLEFGKCDFGSATTLIMDPFRIE